MRGFFSSVCSGAFLVCSAIPVGSALYGQSSALPAQASGPVTLDDAMRRAMANEPAFAAAAADEHVTALERRNARAALLPTAAYHNQVIYTEPNGQSNRIGQTTNEPAPVFIANNAVREYVSQGVFNETLGLTQVAAVRLADAHAARATAELEVARRGLVEAVVELFYDAQSQQDRTAVATRALEEANDFLLVTQQREAARDSAHADVIKAEIQQQQRQRELADTELAGVRARLELAVLLFADPMTDYKLAAPLTPSALPERSAIETAARTNNPELRSAFATLQAADANTFAARAALLPDLAFNVTYGIDAPQFARNGPEGVRNLGYSGSVAVDIPVWDWLTSERKIRETRVLQSAAKSAVDAAQRRSLANLAEFYGEALTAQRALASLDSTVQDARESLRLTRLRYADGEGSVLEVVDAQNTFISAETSRLDGRMRYELALARLQTLTGSLG